jgi:hypothetical protein
MSVLARWARCFVLLAVAGFPLVLPAQSPTPGSRPFLVTMGEVWSTPQPAAGPVNAMNCVIVFPDGHLHLELRRQEFFKEKAGLSVFEGSLKVNEIQILREILDAETITQLPPFTAVTTLLSGSADGMPMFGARISRGKLRQQIGYFVSNGGGPADSVDQKKWRESATALRPLVEWFRALKSAKPRDWRRVANVNANLCEP